MEGPANTTVYMIAGYSVIFVVLGAYLITLIARFRSLKQDEETLRELDQKSS